MSSRIANLRTISSFGQVWVNGLALRAGLRKPHIGMMRPRLVGRIPTITEQNVVRFIEQTGGRIAPYRDETGELLIPHTYFATWGLAEMAHVLHNANLPLNFSHVVHAASTVRVTRMQRLGEPGQFVATVETVSRRSNRVRIELQLKTSTTDDQPLAEYTLAVVLPGPRPRQRTARKSSTYDRRIPKDARALSSFHLDAREGWRYAKLSGDFNPIHWAGPIAKLVGLPGPIAHGFNLMTRATHAFASERGPHGAEAIKCIDVTFRRPVRLPADLTVYVGVPLQREETCSRTPFWIGKQSGGDANVVGRVEVHASERA